MNIPVPTAENLLYLLIGLAVPFDFAMRRLRGFGKWGLSKLPEYDPSEHDHDPARGEQRRQSSSEREPVDGETEGEQ